MMDIPMEYLSALLPLVPLELGLAIFALIHLIHHSQVRIGNKRIQMPVILFLQSLGLILYIVTDKEEQQQQMY